MTRMTTLIIIIENSRSRTSYSKEGGSEYHYYDRTTYVKDSFLIIAELKLWKEAKTYYY